MYISTNSSYSIRYFNIIYPRSVTDRGKKRRKKSVEVFQKTKRREEKKKKFSLENLKWVFAFLLCLFEVFFPLREMTKVGELAKIRPATVQGFALRQTFFFLHLEVLILYYAKSCVRSEMTSLFPEPLFVALSPPA